MPLKPKPDYSTAAAALTWISTQGYRVEHQAAAVLADLGFVARQGLTYRDPTTDKIRDVDVVASMDLVADNPVEMHVAIECKWSSSAWITRTTTTAPAKGRLAWLPVASESVRERLKLNRAPVDGLTIEVPTAFDVIEIESKEQTNPAYAAVLQAVSSAVGLLGSRAQFPQAAVIHPVVVLDGSLYRANLQGPDPDVEPREHERIHWSGATRLDAPVVVDVVTLAGLASFAQRLRSELDVMATGLAQLGDEYPVDPEVLFAWA